MNSRALCLYVALLYPIPKTLTEYSTNTDSEYEFGDYRGKWCLDDHGFVYSIGEVYYPSPSACPCTCTEDGPVCIQPQCPRIHPRCTRIKYKSCCPVCEAVSKVCVYGGKIYRIFEEFRVRFTYKRNMTKRFIKETWQKIGSIYFKWLCTLSKVGSWNLFIILYYTHVKAVFFVCLAWWWRWGHWLLIYPLLHERCRPIVKCNHISTLHQQGVMWGSAGEMAIENSIQVLQWCMLHRFLKYYASFQMTGEHRV